MPGLDGTGPNGAGPMTGGGFGRCGDGTFVRRGAGRGAGAGRGRRVAGSYRDTYDNSDVAALRDENAALNEKVDKLMDAVAELKAGLKHK